MRVEDAEVAHCVWGCQHGEHNNNVQEENWEEEIQANQDSDN
jgi:hypothetical protein